MKLAVVLCLSVLFSQTFVCQNQTKKWYFGNQAGLDFMSSPPAVLVNSAMTVNEGCASMADAAGNLLFYTDGMTVWNQANAVMANGTGLYGTNTPIQSSIIIKQPGNTSLYYIFTVQGHPIMGQTVFYGFNYSVVDMSLAAGMGSVTVKNANLYPLQCNEKLTATRHCNGTDVWVVIHEDISNNFRSYLLTAAGVTSVAVISTAGHNYYNYNYGCMKISPNGKKLGMVDDGNYFDSVTVQLFDFDISSGVVSNALVLNNQNFISYACEFSPDGSKFYCSGNVAPYQLRQWDLCAGSPTAIVASVNTFSANNILHGLQMAPNGKIYVTRFQQQDLGVINNPNLGGSACNFVEIGQSIAPKISGYGLPNFMNSFFNPAPLPFTYSKVCHTVSFTAPGTCSAISYPVISSAWSFGEPASAPNNTATVPNPVHVYQAGGTYTAQLILNYACHADTFRQVITIPNTPAPSFSLTGKTLLCKNQSTTLSAVASPSQGAFTYSWSPITATASLVTVSPTATTVYTVTGTDANGCASTQTLQMTVSACTGIGEQNAAATAISIYPNPNNGHFVIETGGIKTAFKIYNNLGMLVYSGYAEANKQPVDIDHLPNGLYFVELGAALTKQIIKLVKTD